MRGELIAVWGEASGIWTALEQLEDTPADLYCELYRVLADALKQKPTVEELADIIDDPAQSRAAFVGTKSGDFLGERALASFFESAHEALEDLGGDPLSNHYFNLLSSFIDTFSLRYDLRRPCTLCPTVTGVFANLMRALRDTASQDAHLDALMKDFENAVRDLRADSSEGKIKTCIQKQMNLLEALGRAYPGVTGATLGVISDQVGTWPHEKLKLAMKNLYGFSCDYPGIRHGGTAASALRSMDMRDMVAVSILLTGFTPYLGSNLNAVEVFGGGGHVVAVAPVVAAPAAIGVAAPAFQQRRGFFPWVRDLLFGTSR